MKYITSLVLVVLFFSSCNYYKVGLFYLSKNHDKPKLAYNEVQKNNEYTFHFEQGNKDIEETIANISYKPRHRNKKDLTYTLDQYLDEETTTTAFLVIRNDSILYERYWEKFDQTAQLTSFSIAKSFTSALVGFAVQEGYIKNISDPVTNYLVELKNASGYWNELTIEHLLNMRSGIKFDEEDYVKPNSGIAKLYMGKNVMKLMDKVKFKCKPNECHYYSSFDTQILGLILERATNRNLSKYLEEKIWKPLGMEYNATWSIDSKKNQHTKAFCCLQASAIDYAKFGRLYLNGGKWAGNQLLNEDWVNKSVQPNLKNNCYQYQWYSGKGLKITKDEEGELYFKNFSDSISAVAEVENEYEYVRRSYSTPSKWRIRKCGPAFFAMGILGQEIYVDPEKNLIFVRLGQKGDARNETLFKLITKHI